MTLYNYLFPQVALVPRGYNCTAIVPWRLIARRLQRQDVEVVATWCVVADGVEVARMERSFGPANSRERAPQIVFEWNAGDLPNPDEAVFGEIEIATAGRIAAFADRLPVVGYSLAWKRDRKVVMSNPAYKYGSPQIIEMVSTFGSFVEGFPAVRIDRRRDIGQSIVMINPYLRPIVVDVVASDGRPLPRMRVPPRSVRYYNLDVLLRPGEDTWLGQIQLTASNRLINYMGKHALSDTSIVSDLEHLDPYRSDPTHLPLTQRWRLVFGELREKRRARARAAAS